MRFKDLGQEATQHVWREWRSVIREVLDEFNEDAFHGRGRIRENTHKERIYLLLETKQECFYVFPIPGNTLIFSVYRHKIPRDKLNLSVEKPDEEDLVGTFGLGVEGVEAEGTKVKKALKRYLKASLRVVYRNYWLKSSS